MVILLQPGLDNRISFLIVGFLAIIIIVAVALISKKNQKKTISQREKSLTFLINTWIINLK